jgi:hypothetical protein
MAVVTQAQKSWVQQNVPSFWGPLGSSLSDTFDVSDLSVPQVVALVGLVLVALLAWRQIINFITSEV